MNMRTPSKPLPFEVAKRLSFRLPPQSLTDMFKATSYYCLPVSDPPPISRSHPCYKIYCPESLLSSGSFRAGPSSGGHLDPQNWEEGWVNHQCTSMHARTHTQLGDWNQKGQTALHLYDFRKGSKWPLILRPSKSIHPQAHRMPGPEKNREVNWRILYTELSAMRGNKGHMTHISGQEGFLKARGIKSETKRTH